MAGADTAGDLTPASLERSTREIVDCIFRIYARGWCDGTSGNFSLTVARDPLRLLITRAAADKGRISPRDVVLIDHEGEAVAREGAPPSSEAPLHLAIQRETDAGAILHSCSVWGTLLGERFLDERGFLIQGYEMLKGIEGVAGHRDQVHVPVVKNSLDVGTLAERASRVISRRPDIRALLIAGHGLYTWGATLDEAYRHVEVFEFLFQVMGRKHGVSG